MKKIIAIIMVLAMIQLVTALDVKLYDENDFEIDVFVIGQKAVIKVSSEVMPEVMINNETLEINEEDEQMYEYVYEAKEEGTFDVKTTVGNETITTELFVTQELNVDQWKTAHESIDNLENNKTYKGPNSKITLVERNEIEDSLFKQIFNFLKRSWVIVYG
jgi:hypothetical protein